MKNLLSLFLLVFCIQLLQAQSSDSKYVRKHYEKKIYDIPMRDGKKLHTIVYLPKDKSKKYPILMKRTCYSIRPYGKNEYPRSLGPNKLLMQDGYIFVYQDVRGRYMSEGEFTTMTPNIPGNKKKKKKDIDESSDTYDTIEWLLKKLKGRHNKKVGQWGISYPGFYTAAALPDAHPALVASSPQAPIGDFFFDDFHHNGAFLQSYLFAYPVFGYQKTKKEQKGWYNQYFIRTDNKDGYDFNLKLGPLKNVDQYYGKDNFFWQETIEHPNYDEFWQKRGIVQHMEGVNHAVMTVGGLFDAEDLYGPLNIYKNLEKRNKGNFNILVMGPWSHGDWAREKGYQAVNHIYFGDSLSSFYQREIEHPFFNHFLKGEGKIDLPEAYIFDTGKNQWSKFDSWPPKAVEQITLGFNQDGRLLLNESSNADVQFEYGSDPAEPVPYRSEKEGLVFTPRAYMTDDQRHLADRPDVLSFETEVLEEDFTLSGEILAKLQVAMTGTDADFVVKIIDVYPEDHPDFAHNKGKVDMGGYQMLVRAEVMRGRFRESFSTPKPFEANKKTAVNFQLQDIHHSFKKGHKVMIQIHSTWFPYIDRNPQKYVENIYKAKEEDFIKSTITIFGDSVIEIGKIEKK